MKIMGHWFFLFVLAFATVAQTGCTHRQLRYDHVVQARSLTTIYEQQVLDNLAMFSKNPDALPFFAIPGTGSASVTDNGGIAISPLNGPIRTIIGPLSGSRTNNQSWALIPVTDAAKLERMQLLYQDAVSSGVATKSSKKRNLVSECELKGSFCGFHIQVCGKNRAEFTRLALAVLNTAVNDPPAATPAPPTPTVEIQEYKYNESGTVEQIRKFNVDAQSVDLQNHNPISTSSSGSESPEAGGSGSRFLISPNISVNPAAPSSFSESERIKGVITEQQRQILRGTIFPGQ